MVDVKIAPHVRDLPDVYEEYQGWPAEVTDTTRLQPEAWSSSATNTAYGAPTAQGTIPSGPHVRSVTQSSE